MAIGGSMLSSSQMSSIAAPALKMDMGGATSSIGSRMGLAQTPAGGAGGFNISGMAGWGGGGGFGGGGLAKRY